MPFDPDFPFAPADPWQWWRTLTLPRIIVQPNAPANGASGNPAGSDGIDDWIVPGQAPSRTDYPDDWIVPGRAGTDASYPDDWIYPDNRNAPTPAAAPSTAPPAPSPQPNAANPAISNRPAPPPDPFAAYWSLIPASRVGAMAWAPPIFPNSFGQFLLTAPAPVPLNVPPIPAGGLLGGIARMLAAQARANDPWDAAANGILGGIAKMLAASAAANGPSDVGAQGLPGAIAKLPEANSLFPYQPRLPDVGNGPPDAADALRTVQATANGLTDPGVPPGSPERSFASFIPGALANLQPATSNAQADASYLPGSRPFLSPDPIGYLGGGPLYAFLRNDLLNRAEPTGLASDQPPAGVTDPFAQTETGAANSNVIPVADNEESLEQRELKNSKTQMFGGRTETTITPSKIVPALPPALPRALPPPSPGQLSASPRSSSASAPGASAPRADPIGKQPELVEPRAGTPDVAPPAPIGEGGRPTPSAPAPTTPERLQMHLDEAHARLQRDGLTKNQKRSLNDHPGLEAAHRGERIDTFAKKSIADDESLRHLIITPRFQFGPDFYDPINKVWYDITKIGQWAGHERKYAPDFGRGTPLFYGDK